MAVTVLILLWCYCLIIEIEEIKYMNKLLEMIDQPDKDRGKILLAMANNGPSFAYEVAELTGMTTKNCSSHIGDMFKDSGYINITRKKVNGLWRYELVSLSCKMSESRTYKSPRYSGSKEREIPFQKWREVFGLMDTCLG
ncbi:winged helix-turn-helix DNA-binding domain protein [Vibrio phage vB_VcM_SY]